MITEVIMVTKSSPVNIPERQIKSASLHIEGISPLIVRKYPSLRTMKRYCKKARTPVMEFMESLYWLTPIPEECTEESFEAALSAGAEFGFPAAGLKQSAATAAYRAGLARNSITIRAAFQICGGGLIKIHGTPKMREDNVVFGNGKPQALYRAEFPEWAMSIDVKYDATAYSLEQIITFFNLGGTAVGIGNSRAEYGGEHGMYRVV